MEASEKKERIEKLRKQIEHCRRCPLYKTRTHTVPGDGDTSTSIMFIGEAPGKQEDLQGRPFVGQAGSILDQLLSSIGMVRHQIYICNILKCRPPNNRNPLSSEIRACVGSLDIQIKTINPYVIATLGNFATTYIFEKFSVPFSKISAVHGKVFDIQTPFGDKKVVPLFHPAVATYNINKLPVLMDDFKILKKLLAVKDTTHV